MAKMITESDCTGTYSVVSGADLRIFPRCMELGDIAGETWRKTFPSNSLIEISDEGRVRTAKTRKLRKLYISKHELAYRSGGYTQSVLYDFRSAFRYGDATKRSIKNLANAGSKCVHTAAQMRHAATLKLNEEQA
jgi:hypothetical protein